MTVAVRFAPSPTGRLHLGNIRGATINWLMARRTGGRFVLRLDDTDRERSTAEFADAIASDLAWLGFDWDLNVRQSDRLELYRASAEKLVAAGRLYACYETAEELDASRKLQLARGAPPIYDRAGLRLSDAQKRAFEAQGRQPHWRFAIAHRDIAWTDGVRGPAHFQGAVLSDPVLMRADSQPTYTLASVVDDIDLGMTDIVRGEDHVANTAVQIDIFEALGRPAETIRFAHFPLLTDRDGHGLSKRLGSLSVAALRERGLEPTAIVAYLARLGTSDPIEPASLAELAASFDLNKIGRAPPKLDLDELARLNARILHVAPYAAVSPRLAERGIAGIDPALWDLARPNLAVIDDAVYWREVCRGRIAPAIADPDFAAAAAGLLPPEPWDPATWQNWTRAVGAATGRKGRELFRPLRLALTGREDGPELKLLLPMLGYSRARARLMGETA